MGDAGDEGRSFLIDMSDISLRDIESLDETVLGDVLQRVLEGADGPQEAVAGFSSRLPNPF